MVKPNPIQQVLEAEREAGAAVENAREDGERAIAAARRWAQERSRRAESRLRTATARYSEAVRAQRQREANALKERAARDITRRRELAESQLQQLVDEIYAQRWPRS